MQESDLPYLNCRVTVVTEAFPSGNLKELVLVRVCFGETIKITKTVILWFS